MTPPRGRCPWVARRLCPVLVALAAATVTLKAQHPDPAFAVPALDGDAWERLEPTTAGFEARELRTRLAAALNGDVNLHGVVIERHGRLSWLARRRGYLKLISSTEVSVPNRSDWPR